MQGTGKVQARRAPDAWHPDELDIGLYLSYPKDIDIRRKQDSFHTRIFTLVFSHSRAAAARVIGIFGVTV